MQLPFSGTECRFAENGWVACLIEVATMAGLTVFGE